MSARKTKILVVDRCGIAWDRLSRCLPESTRLVRANGADDIEAIYADQTPDIIAVDAAVDDSSSLNLLDRLRQLGPDVRVVVFTDSRELSHAVHALRHGICGYLTGDAADEEILLTIAKAQEDESHIEHSIAMSMIFCSIENADRVSDLGDRELDVLRRLGAGQTIREISATLGLEPKTAWGICSRLRQKLHLRTTPEVIDFAVMLQRANSK